MNNLKQKFDASTVAVIRQALSEVVADGRFRGRKSVKRRGGAYPSAGRVGRVQSQRFEKLGHSKSREPLPEADD
jgi:hypothetical protein